eukprot:7399992-Heterocapsa_arctica.AAC.1
MTIEANLADTEHDLLTVVCADPPGIRHHPPFPLFLFPDCLKHTQCHPNNRTPCYSLYFVRFPQEWRLDIIKIRALRQSTFGAANKRAR